MQVPLPALHSFFSEVVLWHRNHISSWCGFGKQKHWLQVTARKAGEGMKLPAMQGCLIRLSINPSGAPPSQARGSSAQCVDFGQGWHPQLSWSALAGPVPKVRRWDEPLGIHLHQHGHPAAQGPPGPWQGGGGSYLVFPELGSHDASCLGEQDMTQLRLKWGPLWREQS